MPNESAVNLNSSTSSTSSAKSNSDGPEIKGGDPHLLIVYAASPELKGTYANSKLKDYVSYFTNLISL
jgi:hypothetical protein